MSDIGTITTSFIDIIVIIIKKRFVDILSIYLSVFMNTFGTYSYCTPDKYNTITRKNTVYILFVVSTTVVVVVVL